MSDTQKDRAHAQEKALTKIIGRNIYKARKSAGFPRQKLADLWGVTFQQVQKYEDGSNRISPARLWMLAAFLGKDMSSFFTGWDDSDLASLDRGTMEDQIIRQLPLMSTRTVTQVHDLVAGD